MSKAQGKCHFSDHDPFKVRLDLNSGNKLLKDNLVTLYLKTLCIMHYKRIHNVRCSALYLFINNCEKSFLLEMSIIIIILPQNRCFLTYT